MKAIASMFACKNVFGYSNQRCISRVCFFPSCSKPRLIRKLIYKFVKKCFETRAKVWVFVTSTNILLVFETQLVAVIAEAI